MKDITYNDPFKYYLLTEIGNFYFQPEQGQTSAEMYVSAWGDDLNGKQIDEILLDEETIYGTEHDIILYDIQDLIRDFMKKHHLLVATVQIEVDGTETEFGVVFQEHEKISSIEDLSKTFLVSSDIKIYYGIPQNETFYSIGMQSEGEANIIATVLVETLSGEKFTFTENFRRSFTKNCEVMQLTPNFTAILEDAKQINQDAIRLLSVAFSQNDRYMLWIFDHASMLAPNNCFCFFNNFGVLESMWLKGVTTETVKALHSVTVSSHRQLIYDETAERSFKFTSAALSKSMERVLREFIKSGRFYLYMGTKICEAVSNEATFERDDNIKDVNIAEFEFSLVDMIVFTETFGDHTRIFSDTYNLVYG